MTSRRIDEQQGVTFELEDGSGRAIADAMHQSSASPPNASYEQTMTGSPGSPFAWYCHSPGPTAGDRLLRAVAR